MNSEGTITRTADTFLQRSSSCESCLPLHFLALNLPASISRPSAPRAGPAQVNRVKPHFERGGRGPKSKISLGRSDEQRVGDERVPVVAARAPLLERRPGELH